MTDLCPTCGQAVTVVSDNEGTSYYDAYRADCALADELAEALREYDRWASSMPDAGFNIKSPRWDWWTLRRHPVAKANAALGRYDERRKP